MAVTYERLGDIADISAGGTPSRSNESYWKNGKIPWVKISDIKGKYLEKTEEYITEEGLNHSSTKLFKKGTLLYTIFATIGECTILNIDASTNQAIAGINVKRENVLNEYLYYFLSSIKNIVIKTGRGVAQNNINLTILKNIKVPVPEVEVQKKIINVLNKSNELVIKRKAQIEALDQLTQSVFLEMFGDPVINNKKFHVIKGKDLFTLSSGKFISSNEKSKDGKYPIYGGNGINGYCDSYLIDIKTIVIGRVGVYCGNVHLTEPSSWITDNAIYIKDLKKEYNLTFLYYLFRNMNFNRFADYSGQPKITQKPLYELDYMAPDMELQKLFADKVKRIEHQKELLKSGLIELENMYNVLMQKAFNGELFTKEKVSNL